MLRLYYKDRYRVNCIVEKKKNSEALIKVFLLKSGGLLGAPLGFHVRLLCSKTRFHVNTLKHLRVNVFKCIHKHVLLTSPVFALTWIMVTLHHGNHK